MHHYVTNKNRSNIWPANRIWRNFENNFVVVMKTRLAGLRAHHSSTRASPRRIIYKCGRDMSYYSRHTGVHACLARGKRPRANHEGSNPRMTVRRTCVHITRVHRQHPVSGNVTLANPVTHECTKNLNIEITNCQIFPDYHFDWW